MLKINNVNGMVKLANGEKSKCPESRNDIYHHRNPIGFDTKPVKS